MRGRRCARTLTVIALTLVTSPSRADGQALPLEYDADATCPDQEAFSALVLEKLATNGVQESSDRPQIGAQIHVASAGFVGKLALRSSDATNYEREVTGASCAEVANALAFVLALALGAKDVQDAQAQAQYAQDAQDAQDAVIAPAAALPPVSSVKPPATLSAPQEAPKRTVDERSSPWRLGAGAQVGQRTGLAGVTFVGSGFLELRRIAVSPLGFTFRAGFSSAQMATHTDANANTEVYWAAGKLEVCPLRLRLLQALALLPCAGADVGRQRVTGSPHPGPGTRSGTASKLWLDVLASVRVELSLARWLSLEVQGELIVPLTRYRFAFNPDTPAYQAPAVATAAFAGLTAHFP